MSVARLSRALVDRSSTVVRERSRNVKKTRDRHSVHVAVIIPRPGTRAYTYVRINIQTNRALSTRHRILCYITCGDRARAQKQRDNNARKTRGRSRPSIVRDAWPPDSYECHPHHPPPHLVHEEDAYDTRAPDDYHRQIGRKRNINIKRTRNIITVQGVHVRARTRRQSCRRFIRPTPLPPPPGRKKGRFPVSMFPCSRRARRRPVCRTHRPLS